MGVRFLPVFVLAASICSGVAVGSPIVIGHRGAPGYVPEHTLEGYELAIDQGADFIEPDLVISKDGVLFARHENEISGTTDVAKKFPARRTSKTVDGRTRFGWFLEDFTSAEIKTLRAVERLSFRDQSKNGRFEVPTLREILLLLRKKSRQVGRKIGVYPETKHPTYFRGIGLPLEEPLLEALSQAGYGDPQAPVFIQSFEVGNLKALKAITKVPLIQLIGRPSRSPYDFAAKGDTRTYGDLITPEGLREVARYARGIGPHKSLLLPASATKDGSPMSLLLERAHQAGLLVHAYTFRNEPRYIPAVFGADAKRELVQFFKMGIDGVFSDFPDTAVEARSLFLTGK